MKLHGFVRKIGIRTPQVRSDYCMPLINANHEQMLYSESKAYADNIAIIKTDKRGTMGIDLPPRYRTPS